MPEGDTIHKVARSLNQELVGRRLSGVWLRERGWIPERGGDRVGEVEAVGKHLLVGLAPEEGPLAWALHVHLGMHGRWHRYRKGERWQLPASRASLQLTAGTDHWVCFRAARAELLPFGALSVHPSLTRLGPDLLGSHLDLAEVVHRARRREPRTVCDLLLDQTVACGIGNVYKSEILFLEGVHPLARSRELDDARIQQLYRTARRLMQANLGGWRRTTIRRVTEGTPRRGGDPRFFVYDRAGRPCRRCGTAVRTARVGDAARASWWCPVCQSAGAPANRSRAPRT